MRCIIFVLMLAASSSAIYAAQGLPQIPAFLPMVSTVPAGEPSPIDGEWIISTLGKRIRIQAGRAYALDPWLHMFVLQIKPLMVVISEISTTDGQNYVGKDLPLLGSWNASIDGEGSLNVSVQTMMGPVRYGLVPVSLDDRSLFEQAKSGDYVPGEGGTLDEDEDEDEDVEDVDDESFVDDDDDEVDDEDW